MEVFFNLSQSMEVGLVSPLLLGLGLASQGPWIRVWIGFWFHFTCQHLNPTMKKFMIQSSKFSEWKIH